MYKKIISMILCFCVLLTFLVPAYQQFNHANHPDNGIQPYNLIIKTEDN